MKNKSKKLIKVVSMIFIITLVVALLLMFIGNQIKANAVKEKQDAQKYEDLLAETCNCTAHNRIFCPDGFELQNTTCISNTGKFYTAKLIGCSEYNCLGEIKLWNNETGWEK